MEFFGDEVDEIRSFAVADQRTIAKVERLWAPPCRELLLTDEVRARAAELGRTHPQLLEITDKLAQGIAVEGMEALIPALVDELELLVDLLPADTRVLVLDPERARARAHDLVATSEEFLAASWATAASGGQAPIDLQAASYHSLGDVRSHARERGQAWWTFSPFGLDEDDDNSGHSAAQPAPSYRGDVAKAFDDIAGWHRTGHQVVVVHAGHGPAQRMVEALGEVDVPARLLEEVPSGATLDPAVVTITCGALGHGVVDEARKLVVLTGEDVVGAKASTRDKGAMPVRRKRQIDPLELKAGDYVVHEQHGVGRFVELNQREGG